MKTIDDDALFQLLEEAGSSFTVPAHGPEEVLGTLGDDGVVVPFRSRRWVKLVAAAAVVAGAVIGGAVVAGAVGDDSARDQLVGAVARPQATGGTGGSIASGEQRADDSRLLDQYADGSAESPVKRVQMTSALQGAASGGVAAAPAPVTAPGLAPTGFAPQTPAITAPAPDGLAERVVKTGSIALIVDDKKVTPTLTAVQQIGDAAGGYVQDGSTQESGETPSGKVTLRVPVKQFEAVVAKVRKLKAEVRSATTSGRDVTAQYTDLESQLKTLKATRERFLDILARTRTIGEILSVQQRVDGITGQIDKIEGQRRLLERQAEYSTLEVTVTEADDPVLTEKEKPKQNGLATAAGDAKDSFVDGVEALVRRSGTALLVLLCGVAAFFVLRFGWRVSRRRMV